MTPAHHDFSYNSVQMKAAIERLYHSITEVSKLLGEEQHVLRYWEREFSQLKPQKNRAGNRVYTAKDLVILKVIRKLLREERYTVAGAKEYLRQHNVEEMEFEGDTDIMDAAPVEVTIPNTQELARKTAKELREIARELRRKATEV